MSGVLPGRGCWQTIATSGWLRRQAKARGLPRPGLLDAAHLTALVRKGVDGAAELLDTYARNLAVGIANLQQTMAPNFFVLHGDIINGGSVLTDTIARYLEALVPARPGRRIELVAGDAEDQAALKGAAGLECLTKPFDLAEADESAAEFEEGHVNVGAAFVADGKAAEASEPSEGPLHHPSVAAELLAALDAASGDARRNRASPAFPAATLVIVAFVGVQLDGATTRSATTVANAWNGVQGRCQHHAVVPVGARQRHAERRAVPVDHKMPLRARFAAIRRVRADLRSPLLAATLALSS